MTAFPDQLKLSLDEKKIDEKVYAICLELYESFLKAFQGNAQAISAHEPHFFTLLERVEEEVARPHVFASFHKRITAPFNYYQFGIDFLRPLALYTKVTHEGSLDQMERQLTEGDNVILIANHQTEIDPQLISIALEKSHPQFAAELIFVAGDRVLTDPMAVPFSLGRNLLCIYSKRHIDKPLEKKFEKQQHNQRTMKKMKEMLEEGGKCIYVAPSGGRDRANPDGSVDIAPFDAASIEMFRLMTQRSGRQTHFYPLALATYDILPPPQEVETELGEWRRAKKAPALFSFGEEIDMERFPGYDTQDRKARREALALHIWNLVCKDYARLKTC